MNHHYKCAAIHCVWVLFFLYMISFSYYLNTRFISSLSYSIYYRIGLCVFFPSHFRCAAFWSLVFLYRSYKNITLSFVCFENMWRKLRFRMVVVSIIVCVCFLFYVALVVFFWEHNLSLNEKSHNSKLLKIFWCLFFNSQIYW